MVKISGLLDKEHITQRGLVSHKKSIKLNENGRNRGLPERTGVGEIGSDEEEFTARNR